MNPEDLEAHYMGLLTKAEIEYGKALKQLVQCKQEREKALHKMRAYRKVAQDLAMKYETDNDPVHILLSLEAESEPSAQRDPP